MSIKRIEKIIGFAPIKDEIECLDGWVKNIRYFCDEVWAIYDPRSTDGTNEKLKEFEIQYKDSNCPVFLYKQEITLGDSTREKKGMRGEITFLCNMNKFLKTKVPLDHWCLILAADERLDINQVNEYNNKFNALVKKGCNNALIFYLYDMYPDMNHIVNYKLVVKLSHKKIFKNNSFVKYGVTEHSGVVGMNNPAHSKLPFYHLGYQKKTDQENWWRKKSGLNLLMEIPEEERYIKIKNPFIDWRNEA